MNSETFLQGIMTSLQLDACEQAQAQLSAYADGELSTLQYAMTSQHLEHCPRCSFLHTTLHAALRNLPALRSRVVPPEFSASVLRKISEQSAVQQKSGPQRTGRMRNWQSWLLRPRFALESAYAMSAIVALFGGMTGVNAFDSKRIENFASQLSTSSQEIVLQVAQQVAPTGIVEEMSQQVERREQQMQLALQSTLTQGRQRWQVTVDSTSEWLKELPTRLNAELQEQRSTLNDESPDLQP